jgi:hypothetical protein
MNWLKQHYGSAEGPLGFPLTDKQAFALEAIIKSLPKDNAYAYRKIIVGEAGSAAQPAQGANAPRSVLAVTEVSSGERSDVSWISTEDPDRVGDVVCAKGMNDGQFRLNPIVTLNHSYSMPPVGRSLWRKQVKDGPLRGIKAKTLYPPRPASWAEAKDWPADIAFTLVQADLLRGKSIGFLPVKVHVPDAQEKNQRASDGALGNRGEINLIIDEWILLEYACVVLPAQQNAVVESVSKGGPLGPEDQRTTNEMGRWKFGAGESPAATVSNLGTGIRTVERPLLPQEFQKALGLDSRSSAGEMIGLDHRSSMPFTSLAEVEKAITEHIRKINMQELIQARLDLLRGRI